MLRENKYTFPLLLVCATVGISSLLAEHIYFGRREDKLEARAGTNFVGREISERVLAQNNFNEFSYTSEKQEDQPTAEVEEVKNQVVFLPLK